MEVVNLHEVRRRHSTEFIYVGDRIEWQDYTGEVKENIVQKISKSMDELPGFIDSFPFSRKNDYVVELDGGISLSGIAIISKIAKKHVQLKKRASSK